MNRTSRLAVLGAALAGLVTPLLAPARPGRRTVLRRPRRLLRLGHRHPLLHRRRHQLPALHVGLPQPDRRGPRLRAQLPRLLGRDHRRRHQHPALRADLGDQLRHDLGRRQRRRLRRRAHRVRAAGLDEQLRRRDQHRPVLHQRHPARRGWPRSTPASAAASPYAKVVVVGYPRIFNGEDCNAFTWFSPAEESRLNQTADLLNSRLAAAGVGRRLLLRQPDQPLRRARGLRRRRVDQRPLQPDQRELPPQGHRPRRWLHAHGQPAAHRCRCRGHRPGDGRLRRER